MRRSVDLFISKTFLYKLFSMKGPFFIDLDTFTPYTFYFFFLRLTMKREEALCLSLVL
jgi:hypothetical protein